MSPPTSQHPTTNPNRLVFRTGSPSSAPNHLSFMTRRHSNPSTQTTIFEEIPLAVDGKVICKKGDTTLDSLPSTLFVPHSLHWVEGEYGIWVYPETISSGKIVLTPESLKSLLEVFKFLKRQRWAIDALSLGDFTDNGIIRVARPWKLIRDPQGTFLGVMQSNLNNFVSKAGLKEDMKCAFNLLVCNANPAEILDNFPLFYSLDRQIVFLFALSHDRFTQQGNIFEKEHWRDRIFNSILKEELLRQENRPERKREFNNLDMMDFAVFLGNSIRHFYNVKVRQIKTMYDLLRVAKWVFKDVDPLYTLWLGIRPVGKTLGHFKTPGLDFFLKKLGQDKSLLGL